MFWGKVWLVIWSGCTAVAGIASLWLYHDLDEYDWPEF